MQRSLQTTTNAVGKFLTHAEFEHPQGPDFTNLYPANTGGGGSWFRGKNVWSSGGERGKPILEFLFRLFWGNVLLG